MFWMMWMLKSKIWHNVTVWYFKSLFYGTIYIYNHIMVYWYHSIMTRFKSRLLSSVVLKNWYQSYLFPMTYIKIFKSYWVVSFCDWQYLSRPPSRLFLTTILSDNNIISLSPECRFKVSVRYGSTDDDDSDDKDEGETVFGLPPAPSVKYICGHCLIEVL